MVLLLAAVAVLGGVALAALGRAEPMTEFPSDVPPLDLGEVRAEDVTALHPPMSLWGFNVRATEDALRVIARSINLRDVEIAALRGELAQLREDLPGEGGMRPGGAGLWPDE